MPRNSSRLNVVAREKYGLLARVERPDSWYSLTGPSGRQAEDEAGVCSARPQSARRAFGRASARPENQTFI